MIRLFDRNKSFLLVIVLFSIALQGQNCCEEPTPTIETRIVKVLSVQKHMSSSLFDESTCSLVVVADNGERIGLSLGAGSFDRWKSIIPGDIITIRKSDIQRRWRIGEAVPGAMHEDKQVRQKKKAVKKTKGKKNRKASRGEEANQGASFFDKGLGFPVLDTGVLETGAAPIFPIIEEDDDGGMEGENW